MRLLTAILVLSLTACAQTPAGKSVERAQYADIGSTAAAILIGGGREANPLGLGIGVVKPLVGRMFDRSDIHCKPMRNSVRIVNTVTYGAVANNFSIAAGLFSPVGFGIVGGAIYASWYPDGIDCDVPEDVKALVAGFVDAYNRQDSKTLAGYFSEDAVTPTAHHRPHIEWRYSELFKANDYAITQTEHLQTHKGGYVVWITFEGGEVAEWRFKAENGLITLSHL